jgi:hypothetical protein
MKEEIVLKTPEAADRRYRLTPVTVKELRNDPEFIRLPQPRGRCKYCSLSRTTMVEILPYVRHVRLRKEGSKRAIILIHLQSLREFLEARMSEPKPGPDQPEKRRSGAVLAGITGGAGEKERPPSLLVLAALTNFRMPHPRKRTLKTREQS